MKGFKIKDLFLSFKEIIKYDKKLFIIMIADLIIDAMIPFPNILLSGLIVDSLVDHQSFFTVALYVFLMFGSDFLITSVGTVLRNVREFKVIKFINHLNNEINNKCLNIDFEQFNDSAFQERIHFISTMVQGDNYLNNLTLALQSLSQLITVIGIIIIITMLNGWLLIVSVLVMILQALLHLARLKNNRRHNFETINERRKVAYATQMARDIDVKKDIQIFGMEKYILRKISKFYDILLTFEKKRIHKSGIIEIFTYLLVISFKISAYMVLGIETYKGALSIGDFTKGISSLLSFMSASTFLTTNIMNYGEGIFYIHKYRSFLKLRSKYDYEVIKPKNERQDNEQIKIEFKNVSFRYPNSTNYVLKNINLTIYDSEKLGIVGYNGAGKTTFALLLTRMYDPTEGAIYLNGTDIRNIDYREYLKKFSTVYQDFTLTAFSIMENIGINDTKSDKEKSIITKLLQDNGMGERIKKMYRGIDTPITKTLEPSGVDLSGGERQKIAIVRALYKEAPILILDEPTSSLDPAAEQDLYLKFAEMSNGKTAVYISHRIYSTKFCDKIAVFADGEIKEIGTYEELMNKKGLYFELYQQQASYFTD